MDNVVVLEKKENKLTYDIENGILNVEGIGYAKITTEVIDDTLTEVEKQKVIELDKKLTLEYFEMLKSEPLILRMDYSASSIPTNAPIGYSFTLKKDISELVGDVGELLSVISDFTDVLSFCPAIPYSTILKAVSDYTGYAADALEVASSVISGEWIYKMETTKYTYQVGITQQTATRYCQVGLDMYVKVFGKSYKIYKGYAKTGGWWVSQKPY